MPQVLTLKRVAGKFMLALTAAYLIANLLTGCIHLPSPAGPKVNLPAPTETVEPKQSMLAKIFTPTKVTSEASQNSAVATPVNHSPTHQAIQTAANWQATLCTLGGLACLALGGLSIYGGQLIPGIKFIVAGVLLPIFGIWFAYNWLLIVILTLVGLGLYLLFTHYAVVQPLMKKLESSAVTVGTKVEDATGIDLPLVPGSPSSRAAAAKPVVVTGTLPAS